MGEMVYGNFENKESNYSYDSGVNSGFTHAYTEVSRCLFLSSQAKQLYTNITSYAFSGEKECFPDVATLRLELGWSKPTFYKFKQELVEKGFLGIKHKGGGVLDIYVIKELDPIPSLIHSEIIYALKSRRPERGYGEEFLEKMKEYKESELFEKVSESPHPEWFLPELKEFFLGEQIDPPVKVEPLRKPRALPKPINIDVQKECSEGIKKIAKTKFSETALGEWTNNHFCDYFSSQYLDKMKAKYLVTLADKSAMKRILKGREDNAKVKAMIDDYMKLDYFAVKVITGFSSSFVQSALITYQTTGTLQIGKPPEKSKTTNTKRAESAEEAEDYEFENKMFGRPFGYREVEPTEQEKREQKMADDDFYDSWMTKL